MPCSDDEIGIIEHALENVGPIDGSSFAECGSFVEINSGIDSNGGGVAVFDVHWGEFRVAHV